MKEMNIKKTLLYSLMTILLWLVYFGFNEIYSKIFNINLDILPTSNSIHLPTARTLSFTT